MKDLQTRIAQQRLQARRRPVAAVELDEMGRAVAARELHQTEPVTVGLQPERLGVDRHRTGEAHARRQIAFMQRDNRRFHSRADGTSLCG